MKLNNKKDVKVRKITLLLFAIISTSLWGDFTRDNSGVVADSKTGLAWQDTYNGRKIKSAVWEDALVYCHELNLGNKNDWRLPNIMELDSLIDKSNYQPAINSVFQSRSSSYFWSSTTNISESSSAWRVRFEYGLDDWDSKINKYYVRCVRGGE